MLHQGLRLVLAKLVHLRARCDALVEDAVWLLEQLTQHLQASQALLTSSEGTAYAYTHQCWVMPMKRTC